LPGADVAAAIAGAAVESGPGAPLLPPHANPIIKGFFDGNLDVPGCLELDCGDGEILSLS
jgi:hypothetical protein